MMENNYGLSLSLSEINMVVFMYLFLFNLPCLHDRGMHIFIGRWCHLCIFPYSSVSRTARWISVEYSGVGSLTLATPGVLYKIFNEFFVDSLNVLTVLVTRLGAIFSVRFDPSNSRFELRTARF